MSKEQQNNENENKLYRDQYRGLLRWIMYMSLLTIFLTAALTYILVFDKRKADFYATTTTGQVIPLHSLSEPVITTKYLLEWAELATRRAYNLGYVHYQSQLSAAKGYFTPGGWDQFKKALASSDLLDTVINQKLNMSAVVAKQPVITNRAVINGRYTWRVQLPILVTYVSASMHRQTKLLITMNIQRVPTLDAAKGISISAFRSSENNY